MNDLKQTDFLLRACRAIHGQGATLTVQTVAEAIELAYRQGVSDGFNLRVEDQLCAEAGKYNFKSEEIRDAHDLTY